MVDFTHAPVMLNECIEGLDVKESGIYADCTAGGGGHSEEIIKRLNESGMLIAIDRDINAVNAVKKRLGAYGYKGKLAAVHDNFINAGKILNKFGVTLDGALLDLGVSSYQLDVPERGFSYSHNAPLDMRMNNEDSLTAYDVVNGYKESELTEILYKWGEEKFASRIAAFIVRARERKRIETTFDLTDIVKAAIPAGARDTGRHPCKRTFQAIRIEVNGELVSIEPALKTLVQYMNPRGRIAVITFHSLEDRIVKQTFADMAAGCKCPRDFPVCVCGTIPSVRIITKKPVLPSAEEVEKNPRSRSAKLRIAEKI